MRSHSRGFTAIEALLSGSILVVLMLSAITASTSATVSTKNTSEASERTAQLLRSEDKFKGWLSAASRGSLEGIPVPFLVRVLTPDGFLLSEYRLRGLEFAQSDPDLSLP